MLAIVPLFFWAWLNGESPLGSEKGKEESDKDKKQIEKIDRKKKIQDQKISSEKKDILKSSPPEQWDIEYQKVLKCLSRFKNTAKSKTFLIF